MNRHAVVLALLSAALFGIATPAAKSLLGEISPTILAALFYCGAGIGIAILRHARAYTNTEASLNRLELPWLGAAILSGGIVGPLLLMALFGRLPLALGATVVIQASKNLHRCGHDGTTGTKLNSNVVGRHATNLFAAPFPDSNHAGANSRE
jgi:drug/metabolite transporter (DMT)-like permease